MNVIAAYVKHYEVLSLHLGFEHQVTANFNKTFNNLLKLNKIVSHHGLLYNYIHA